MILNIGCGMDRLSSEIYADGYTKLISSDISPHAIQEMQEKTAAEMPNAKWCLSDQRDSESLLKRASKDGGRHNADEAGERVHRYRGG